MSPRCQRRACDACDHECRRGAVRGCLDDVLICCASEQSRRLHVGHVGRGALLRPSASAIGATAVRYSSRVASLRHAALEHLPQGHDQAASCCSAVRCIKYLQ
jgi:hypothetical protein